MAYFRKTNRPAKGTLLQAISEAGSNGKYFTLFQVQGQWSRRQLQVNLAELKRRGTVRVVRPSTLGRYALPALYALQKKDV